MLPAHTPYFRLSSLRKGEEKGRHSQSPCAAFMYSMQASWEHHTLAQDRTKLSKSRCEGIETSLSSELTKTTSNFLGCVSPFTSS